MHPPEPEMQRAALPGGPDRNPENQPSEITATTRQAQYLSRFYALSSAVAYAVAELAFAGGPR